MRARIVYEVVQIGNLIASPRIAEESMGDGYARGVITYVWWYRPVVRLAFWICGESDV